MRAEALKWFFWRTLRQFNIDMRPVASGLTILEFIRVRNIDLVIDVGANAGQFGRLLRNMGYNADIVSFEPIRAPFEELNQQAKRDGRWAAHNLAIGDAAGTTEMHVGASTLLSSMLPLTQFGKDFSRAGAEGLMQDVTVARLDDVCREFFSRNSILKIDVQGFEKPALCGASELLTHLQGVQLELPVEHLYEDTWEMHEAIEFMLAKGFALAQVSAVNRLPTDSFRRFGV